MFRGFILYTVYLNSEDDLVAIVTRSHHRERDSAGGREHHQTPPTVLYTAAWPWKHSSDPLSIRAIIHHVGTMISLKRQPC